MGEAAEREGSARASEHLGAQEGPLEKLQSAVTAPWGTASELNVPGPLEALPFPIHCYQ
jgi:hypothetical protein